MKKNNIPDENSLGCRISELRKDRSWTQNDLAEKLHVHRSQISRLESGESQSISFALLADIAKLFNVSSDYLLALTVVSTPKSYDISQLGLSEDTVKRLITKTVDAGILNRLIEHRNFPSMLRLIGSYFNGTAARGIAERNALIDIVTDTIKGEMPLKPECREEMKEDIRYLNAQKIGESEADYEKIRNIFMAILRDIKKDMDDGKATTPTASSAAAKRITELLPDKPRSEITSDDMADATVQYLVESVGLKKGLQKATKKFLRMVFNVKNWIG